MLKAKACLVAEKSFLDLRSLAIANPEMSFIAVSHSSQADTDAWVASLPAPEGFDVKVPANLTVHVDENREIYAKWGLGLSSYWEVFSPWGLADAVNLGRQKGIHNRPTGSGYRLQRAGSFAVDGEGMVVWVHVSKQASDMS